MLFRNFLEQYIQDLNSCWDLEIDNLTDNEIEKIVNDIQEDDYIWEMLDDAVFDGLDAVRRKREGSDHDESI